MFLCSYSILIIQIFSNHKCACSHSVSPDFECFFINCSGVSVCFKEKKKWKTFFNQLWSQKKFPAQMAARDYKTSIFLMSFDDRVRLYSPSFLFMSSFFHCCHSNWISLRLLIGSSFVDNIRSMLKTIWPRNLIFNYIMHCKVKTRLF